MIRIIRTATLASFRADSTELPTVRAELARAKQEAAAATDSAIRAENLAETQLRQLAQAHADRIQADRDLASARADLAQQRAETNDQLTELREDLAKLRAAAADPDTGQTVRSALACNILRDLYADAWKEGLLPKRPFDLLAVVLDFDTADQKTPTPAPAV